VVAATFLLGLVVGSFLNVVILRGAKGEKFSGRSRCESCGRQLTTLELIPVLSFLIQKARCRSCGTVLSWQYPLVELGTGILYAAGAWYFFGSQPILFFLLAFAGIAAGVVILVSDFRYQIIPNGAVFILLLVGVAALALRLFQTKSNTSVPDLVWNMSLDVETALLLAFFLASLWFFSKGAWMGFGDAKLIFATSLIVGFPASIAAFLFSFWLGGIVGIVLLLSRRKTLKSHIPFGPFILLGTVAAYFFAEDLWSIIGL